MTLSCPDESRRKRRKKSVNNHRAAIGVWLRLEIVDVR